MRYYDPKTDVVFKKVFGEHKNLAISLLNAVLQLEGKNQIKDLEYLPSEILPITIGEDCWLGGGVTVCPGVTIGDRCIIGAGSVVVKDIPSDSMAVGNPCRVIRKLNA